MAEDPEEHTILMFPFMGQGHLIPFLALALHIERTKKKRYNITLINTPKNIKNLRSSLPPDSSICLLEIPFNSSDHGLPLNVENFDSVPYHHVIRLLEASISFRDPFRKVLSDLLRNKSGESGLCVIGDIFLGWMGRVCRELGVFFAIFSGSGGFGMASYYSFWLNLPQKSSEGGEIFLEDFPEAGKFHKTQLSASMLEADGTDPWSIFQKNNFAKWMNSDAILFNTVEELDHLGLSYFRRNLGFPIWAIGPVLLSSENRPITGAETEGLKIWLDGKPENSVLYVSFGSMNTISQTHMMNLAMALEASARNFIWVVRPPIGFDINGEFRSKEWLPQGFEERMKESRKGIIVQKWAPQVDILQHKSTSVFLSHCGWNSVLESLSHGVPLLGWPMAGEQFFNSKFLEEETGVCIEVARGKNCVIRYEDVVSKINLVMDDNERGREIRRKADRVKKMIKRAMEKDGRGVEGPSIKAMDEFLTAAMVMKKREVEDEV